MCLGPTCMCLLHPINHSEMFDKLNQELLHYIVHAEVRVQVESECRLFFLFVNISQMLTDDR